MKVKIRAKSEIKLKVGEASIDWQFVKDADLVDVLEALIKGSGLSGKELKIVQNYVQEALDIDCQVDEI